MFSLRTLLMSVVGTLVVCYGLHNMLSHPDLGSKLGLTTCLLGLVVLAPALYDVIRELRQSQSLDDRKVDTAAQEVPES